MVRVGLQTILMMISLVLVNTISGFCTKRAGDTVNAADGRNSKSTTIRNSKSADVEIRFEFISISPNMDDSTAPLFITIRRDGRTRALRYGLRYQAKNVAAYERTLPEAEVETLFQRVQVAFRLPKHRKDYRRDLIYEDNSFYLAVKSDNGKIKEMFGGDGPRPDEVRALLAEMSGLWKRLNEVSSADAYFTTRQMEEDRFKRVRQERGTNLTSIDSLPTELRSILIRAFNETYNFYPLNMTQYSLIQTYKRPIIYKRKAYELMLLPSAKEVQPIRKN